MYRRNSRTSASAVTIT